MTSTGTKRQAISYGEMLRDVVYSTMEQEQSRLNAVATENRSNILSVGSYHEAWLYPSILRSALTDNRISFVTFKMENANPPAVRVDMILGSASISNASALCEITGPSRSHGSDLTRDLLSDYVKLDDLAEECPSARMVVIAIAYGNEREMAVWGAGDWSAIQKQLTKGWVALPPSRGLELPANEVLKVFVLERPASE